MNEQKHTPGPWRVTPEGYIAGKGFVPIRTPFRADAFDGPQRSDHAEETLLANATLIAAAPELLDALSALVEWCDVSGLSAVPGDGTEYSVIRDARAAIAKAKGE